MSMSTTSSKTAGIDPPVSPVDGRDTTSSYHSTAAVVVQDQAICSAEQRNESSSRSSRLTLTAANSDYLVSEHEDNDGGDGSKGYRTGGSRRITSESGAEIIDAGGEGDDEDDRDVSEVSAFFSSAWWLDFTWGFIFFRCFYVLGLFNIFLSITVRSTSIIKANFFCKCRLLESSTLFISHLPLPPANPNVMNNCYMYDNNKNTIVTFNYVYTESSIINILIGCTSCGSRIYMLATIFANKLLYYEYTKSRQ